MKRHVLFLMTIILIPIPALSCDCMVYPFVPNPPCYDKCTSYLKINKNIDLSKIKNIDPAVKMSIAILRSVSEKKPYNSDRMEWAGSPNKERLIEEAVKNVPDKGEMIMNDKSMQQ